MRGLWAVCKREFMMRVRSKAFILVTLVAPLLMVGLFALPVYMEVRSQGLEQRFVLVDETGVVAEHLEPRLTEAGYEVTVEPWSEGVVEREVARVRDEEVGALVVVDEETLRSGVATIHTRSQPSALRRVLIQTAVVQSAVAASLGDVDADALLDGGDLTIEMLGEDADARPPAQLAAGFVGSMIIYMAVILWAVAVMRATLEEKRDRIAEIIVSSMKPWHLMLGKMVGVGGVGLLQLTMWGVVIGAFMALGMPGLMAARPEWAALQRIQDAVPGPGTSVLFVGFFLGGYFIFSGFYAAIGAMCNSDEEVQQVQLPVIMVYMVPILFLAPVVEDPSGTFATAMSLVPFFSPVLMWPRVAAGVAPWWQIALSYLGMALAVVAVAWLAGRIYKVGMLMAGKRPTLPELWRWMREA